MNGSGSSESTDRRLNPYHINKKTRLPAGNDRQCFCCRFIFSYKLNISATYQGYKRTTSINVLVISNALYNFVNDANFHFGAGFSKTSILTNCANLYFGGSARNCMHRIIDGRINVYSNADFVRRLYKAVLGRDYDQGGYEFWVHSLQYGSSRMQVLNGFLYSDEFANRCSKLGINL